MIVPIEPTPVPELSAADVTTLTVASSGGFTAEQIANFSAMTAADKVRLLQLIAAYIRTHPG